MLQPIFSLNDRLSLSLSWPMQLLHYALTVGSIIRMNVHIYVSLAADLDPALADADVTLASPCLELREHTKHDVTARLLSTAVSLIMVWMGLQIGISVTGVSDYLIVGFAAANIVLPLCDPLWYLLDRL